MGEIFFIHINLNECSCNRYGRQLSLISSVLTQFGNYDRPHCFHIKFDGHFFLRLLVFAMFWNRNGKFSIALRIELPIITIVSTSKLPGETLPRYSNAPDSDCLILIVKKLLQNVQCFPQGNLPKYSIFPTICKLSSYFRFKKRM